MGVDCHGNTIPCTHTKYQYFENFLKGTLFEKKICFNFSTLCSVKYRLFGGC